MNISSLIVTCEPKQRLEVEKALTALPGVEVFTSTEDGRIIVVSEQPDLDRETTTFQAIQALDSVLTVSLAYHHYEEELPCPNPVATS